jgi:hypothetical protein
MNSVLLETFSPKIINQRYKIKINLTKNTTKAVIKTWGINSKSKYLKIDRIDIKIK